MRIIPIVRKGKTPIHIYKIGIWAETDNLPRTATGDGFAHLNRSMAEGQFSYPMCF